MPSKIPLPWVAAGLGCLGLVSMVAGIGALVAAGTMSRSKKTSTTHVTAGGPVQCPVQQEQASNGDEISEDLAHDLIVCLWQQPASVASEEVTCEVTNVSVGKRRKWNPYDDMGSGNVDTWVYPVRATFTRRSIYRTEDVVVTDDGVFNCYVDAFNKWECGLGQNLTRSSPQHIRK